MTCITKLQNQREKDMFRRVLTVAVDICLLIAALAGMWRIWYVYRYTPVAVTQQDLRTGMIGTTLNYVSVDWSKANTNLVMVLNKDCHFCTESAPFYRHLIASVRGRTQVVALFAHDVAAAKTYLDGLTLEVPIIRGSVSFPRPVPTPTLMLCDGSGKITRVWMGKLTAPEESEVLSIIEAANHSLSSCSQPPCAPIASSYPTEPVKLDKR
jgi:hypothetical protein